MRDLFGATWMQKILVGIGGLLVIAVVAVGTLALRSGYADPPGLFFGGGPLVTGEFVREPEPDWSFLGDVRTIDLQLLDPPRSRVVWIADYDGKAYVVSGYMGGVVGRLWKHWPAQAERDGRAVIRINGKRYARTLVRVTSGMEVLEGVSAELERKYGFGQPGSIEAGETWLFELAPRDAGDTGAGL